MNAKEKVGRLDVDPVIIDGTDGMGYGNGSGHAHHPTSGGGDRVADNDLQRFELSTCGQNTTQYAFELGLLKIPVAAKGGRKTNDSVMIKTWLFTEQNEPGI